MNTPQLVVNSNYIRLLMTISSSWQHLLSL